MTRFQVIVWLNFSGTRLSINIPDEYENNIKAYIDILSGTIPNVNVFMVHDSENPGRENTKTFKVQVNVTALN